MKTQIKQNEVSGFAVKNVFTVVGILCFMGFSLFQSETLAANLCSQIFATTEVVAKPQAGAQFLHEKNPQLHTSSSVEKSASQYKRASGKSLTKPAEKINQWFEQLTRISSKAETSHRTSALVKDSLQKQFVMKAEEVPESYYAQQVRIARERGHGDIDLTREQRAQMAESVISDQQKSLDSWTGYLISKDTSMYPMWLKYWMFTGMTKLSKYDPQTGSFGKRSKETVAPFIELNREALAYVADAVLKKINKQSLNEIKDPELVKLLEGLSFEKLYGRTLFNLGVGKNGGFETNQGRWVVYAQNSDHMPLVRSLEGRNTGWCTAGESTAQSQLSKGDFHVYYSLNEKGEAAIPRVAIRMEGDQIAEVRGVAAEQNLDPQINQSTVVASKMHEFGDRGKAFEKKDLDMKRLTEIERKNKLGESLSKEDLKFLYETDEKIVGFGYEADPRIQEIKKTRDLKSDVVIIYDHKYSRDEVSTTRQEALSGKSKIHFGKLDLSDLKFPERLTLPEVVIGSLDLGSLKWTPGLKLPKIVKGDLDLGKLTSAQGMELPTEVHGWVNLSSLKTGNGVKLPDIIKGDLFLFSLESAIGLEFPKAINGSLTLHNLKSAVGLRLPESINGTLYLISLLSAEGLVLPKTVNGDLKLDALDSAKGLKKPEGVRFYEGPPDIQP